MHKSHITHKSFWSQVNLCDIFPTFSELQKTYVIRINDRVIRQSQCQVLSAWESKNLIMPWWNLRQHPNLWRKTKLHTIHSILNLVCALKAFENSFSMSSPLSICLLIKDFALAESCYEPVSTMGIEEMQGLQHCILNAFSSAS